MHHGLLPGFLGGLILLFTSKYSSRIVVLSCSSLSIAVKSYSCHLASFFDHHEIVRGHMKPASDNAFWPLSLRDSYLSPQVAFVGTLWLYGWCHSQADHWPFSWGLKNVVAYQESNPHLRSERGVKMLIKCSEAIVLKHVEDIDKICKINRKRW